MGTYRSWRPVKRWLIPLVAVFIGLVGGYTLFPSEQDYDYKQWQQHIDQMEADYNYQISTIYTLNDQLISTSETTWSQEAVKIEVSTRISDETNFDLDLYFEEDLFFVQSGDMWLRADLPHRVEEEAAPLNQPFEWLRDVVSQADEVSVIRGNGLITYEAVFDSFRDLDFRGFHLQEQEHTYLRMVVQEDGHIELVSFFIEPIPPDYIGTYDIYPEQLTWDMRFVVLDDEVQRAPPLAYKGEIME